MTALRKNAFDLLERMPEDKLIFLVQIMQGIDDLALTPEEAERKAERERAKRREAFEQLERLIHHVPDLDEKKELASWREEKFGYARAN